MIPEQIPSIRVDEDALLAEFFLKVMLLFFFAISERLQREGKYLHVSVLWMFTRCIYMIIIHVAVYACSINVRHTENCCMLNYALQTSPYRSYIR